MKTATVDYFDIKTGDQVIVIERHHEYDGEKLELPYSECVLATDPRIVNKPLTAGKIHYMYDFELSRDDE